MLTAASLVQQIKNTWLPHFKSVEDINILIWRSHLQRGEADYLYLDTEYCETQGNFQRFKEAFMTTPWEHTYSPPCRTKDTAFAHLSLKKKKPQLFWILNCPTLAAHVFCSATGLSGMWRSKSILNCGTLFHCRGGWLHEHLQRSVNLSIVALCQNWERQRNI